uniref:Uncharacterized protein n=1 Tax=Meloidogyne hapla TaxID=6305 RepID=A0A1I8BPU9_MELHA
MFLIAKIVRGRRLLHQLEQQEEKAKAAAKQHEQREKLSRGVSGVGSIAVSTALNCPIRTGTLKENLKIKANTEVDDLAVIELVEFSPQNISDDSGGGNEGVDKIEKASPTSAFNFDQQLVDRVQKPRK